MWTVEPRGLCRVSASWSREVRDQWGGVLDVTVERWRTSRGSYCGESVLVPQGADDKRHQPTLLNPAHGQLRTQREEVTHLVHVEGTIPGH